MLRAGMLTADKLPRIFETIERNASALTRMVEDILDVSRVVSGKMRLNMQPVELPTVLYEAIATMMPAAEAKHIRLETTIDPQVGPVSGDPDRLRQIVWNLLSNAVKFTPKQGRIQARLERVNSSVDRAKTLQGGFEIHLAKPIDPVELISAVKALARRRRDTADPK
jgi:signal transduction histidine kinase